MAYGLLAAIVLCQIALAIGNYLLRPRPRPSAAKLMLLIGLILACAVVAQFVLGQATLNGTLYNLRGQMMGIAGGGGL